ncbi:MAG: MurR/RpiR family transcriptional regulator [Oscillospiraceae bacterium]|nr:MurR/RpiR family transcriptional regulator [Oscillospiraceae bacterium]
MSTSILNTIEDAIPALTRKQQEIALAILADPLSVTFSTVHEFAARVGVSPASVVRFSQHFSQGGFPELQSALQKHIQEVSDPIKRMELNFIPDSDDGILVSKIYETQLRNLKNTFNRAFINSALAAAELISSAEHIYTFGSRGSRSVAYYLGHHLNRVFSNADLVPEDDRLADRILRATDRDVAIVFALPRYSTRLLAAVRQMREVGVKIVTVNDAPQSPFAELADVAFYVAYHSSDFHNSQLSSMLLAETIISLLISHDRKTSLQNLDRIENNFDKLDQFTK